MTSSKTYGLLPKKSRKGFLNLEILVGFFIVMLIYLFAFAPLINDAVANYTAGGNTSTLSVQIVVLIVPFIFLMLLVGLYTLAHGRQPSWDK